MTTKQVAQDEVTGEEVKFKTHAQWGHGHRTQDTRLNEKQC